jgi:formylglycine-generating enzyme
MTASTVVPKGMARVPSGTFTMGSDAYYPEERPEHAVTVSGFAVDLHPVTNAEFRHFVAETGHVTTAEQVPSAEDFPDADPDLLVVGSLVFRPTAGPVPLDDWRRWWHWVPGAWWKAPDGPGSNLGGRDRHPVVHVSYEDALTYASWAGKTLPTEAEWEYAARAGQPPTTYAWGSEMRPKGRAMANTWEGRFPWENLSRREPTTTPVGRYAPNAWGLLDMIGNVWEWTVTPWTDDHTQTAGGAAAHAEHGCCAPTVADPVTEDDRRVMKGGSHLCSPDYCERYRPPARQGQRVRSSTSHLGFRCIIRD